MHDQLGVGCTESDMFLGPIGENKQVINAEI